MQLARMWMWRVNGLGISFHGVWRLEGCENLWTATCPINLLLLLGFHHHYFLVSSLLLCSSYSSPPSPSLVCLVSQFMSEFRMSIFIGLPPPLPSPLPPTRHFTLPSLLTLCYLTGHIPTASRSCAELDCGRRSLRRFVDASSRVGHQDAHTTRAARADAGARKSYGISVDPVNRVVWFLEK